VWPAFKFLVDRVFELGGFLFRIGSQVYTTVASVVEVLGRVVNTMFPIFGFISSELFTQATSIFSGVAFYIEHMLIPTLSAISPAFATVMQLFALVQFVIPGIRAVIGYFQELWTSTSTLAQVLRSAAEVIGNIFNPLAGMGSSIETAFGLAGQHIEGAARAQEGAVRQSTAAIPDWMLAIQKSISSIGKGNADLGRTGRGDRTNRPHAMQDFRYSRFDITQRFAEGFDPDRVASAFASDLEAMASQRLSSGFAPAFSLP
jgi:phage-related protein